ncbi:CxxxxCH/CxxCH domain-containing protein [Cronobacter turicensis]|nr:CxxxxCH/CxxCH domain-containing protein [Cronobacter turicensis]ELY3626230.1 CxxxxCH/CxxCH domain-containing protein [Cronobacter turicensis]
MPGAAASYPAWGELVGVSAGCGGCHIRR